MTSEEENTVTAKFSEGFALHQQGALDRARELYQQVLKLNPRHFDALHLLGVLSIQTKDPEQAVELVTRAIEINPGVADAYSNRGNALLALKRHEEALQNFDRAIAYNPDYAVAYYNRGLALKELKRFDAALQSYDKAIALKPDYADAYNNRGTVLGELERYDAALQSYDKAIALEANNAAAYNNRGITLKELKRYDVALENYDRAIALKPDFAEAHYNRANALHELKQYDTALQSYDEAIALKPDHADAYYNRGIVLRELERYDAALESYDRAIAFKADYVEAYNNRGTVLKELKRHDAALQCYDKALALKPDYAEALYNRGNALHELKRHDAALQSYDKAIALKPDSKSLYGIWLHTKMVLCDWRDVDKAFARLFELVGVGERASDPFPFLGISSSPALQRKVVDIFVHESYPAATIPSEPEPLPKHEKIRIGYFSADFHNHATAYLIAELFERHDKSKFEVTALSFGPNTNDEMRKRLSAGADSFIDIHSLSDGDVALLARKLEIDIAIDLTGFTRDCRLGIFALRAAPIQVNYLGYPGTMGVDCIDYLIADATLIPEADRRHYAEKIVYLPDSYQVNDSKRRISDRIFTRGEVGLPPSGFVFCCFNKNYKILPDTFEGWMRILKQAEGSVLWLFQDNETAARNLRQEAAARGVAPDRLVFARQMPLADHLARHRLADLFLDTLPCNAHTTASDALWAGLPILTRIGETFAGRVAASLLRAIGLPELITATQEEYERLAIALATDPGRLAQLKHKLERNRLTTPLFDTALFTRHIEAAYMMMYERHHAGLPPTHLWPT